METSCRGLGAGDPPGRGDEKDMSSASDAKGDDDLIHHVSLYS